MTGGLMKNFRRLLKTRINDLQNQEQYFFELARKSPGEDEDDRKSREQLRQVRKQLLNLSRRLNQSYKKGFGHCWQCGGQIEPQRLFEHSAINYCESCST